MVKSKSKLIVMAAGIGSRMKPYTNNTPKCLFSLGRNITPLGRIIDTFRNKLDIYVVTGFRKEQIENAYPDIKTIFNPFYSVTNSVSSLWFARELLEGEAIIMNADIIVEDKISDLLMNSKKENFVLIDSSRSDEADYKVFVNNGRVVTMDKTLKQSSGEYVGFCKLSGDALSSFRNSIEKMIEEGQIDDWFETALVKMIMSDEIVLEYEDVSGMKWTEIDSPNDFILAKKVISDE
jgi:choline kinase